MRMMARKPMGRWRFRADPLGRTAPASERTPDCGFPERTPYSGVEGEDLIGRVIRTTRRCTRPPSRRPPDRTARWSSETGRRCSRAGRRRRRRPRRAGSSTAVAETSSAPRPYVRDTLSRVVELLADGRPLLASYAEDKVWEDAADTPASRSFTPSPSPASAGAARRPCHMTAAFAKGVAARLRLRNMRPVPGDANADRLRSSTCCARFCCTWGAGTRCVKPWCGPGRRVWAICPMSRCSSG